MLGFKLGKLRFLPENAVFILSGGTHRETPKNPAEMRENTCIIGLFVVASWRNRRML